MPFAYVSLKTLIPREYDFEPVSIGDHIRKKRLQLGLFQREVAKQLEVNPWTVLNWEKGKTEVPIGSIPAVLQFLGYDPFPEPETVSQHLLSKRRAMGWTIREAAQVVGVDPGTWGRWERGQPVLYRKHQDLVTQFLGLSVEAFNNNEASSES